MVSDIVLVGWLVILLKQSVDDVARISTCLLHQVFRLLFKLTSVDLFQCILDDSALEGLIWDDEHRWCPLLTSLILEECQGFSVAVLKRIVKSRVPASTTSRHLDNEEPGAMLNFEVHACSVAMSEDDLGWFEAQPQLRFKWDGQVGSMGPACCNRDIGAHQFTF